MSQTRIGSTKVAARRIGVSFDEYVARRANGEKWCTDGRHWLPTTAFATDRSRSDGLKHACRSCTSSRKTSHPPSKEARMMAAIRGLIWCSKCQDWRSGSGRLCREHLSAYAREHYAKSESFRERRRAKNYRRIRGVDRVPPEGRERLFENYNGICIYCSKPADTIDHLVPVAKGGRTTPGNVAPACRRCNSRKRDMPLDDWLDRLEAEGWQPTEEAVYALIFMECSLYG